VRAIFFDASGVLYDRRGSTAELLARLLGERGYRAELDAPAHAERARLNGLAKTGGIDARELWDRVLRLHGVESEVERRELIGHVFEAAHEVFALPGVPDALIELDRRGLALGVISDTIYPESWKRRWLAVVGVLDILDVVVCSNVVGARKPDPAIYRAALDRAEVPASESAFVGHDARELEGALAVGMLTVGIGAGGGDHRLDSLGDLPSLLARGRIV